MGLDMELKFEEKQCRVGLSPKTVLPSNRHCAKVDNRNAKVKPSCTHDLLSIEEDFEINFGCYRSHSCKNIPSRPVGLEGKLEYRRGSVYQTSKEVRRMKKMGTVETRRKVEISPSNDTSFSFRIDSLCSLDEESPQKISSVRSLNSDLKKMSVHKPKVEPCSSDGFIDISLNAGSREKHSAETAERGSMKDPNFNCDQVVGPLNDGNDLLEKDTVCRFHNAKVETPQSPSQYESDHSVVSLKSRFSPIRKMFDPLMKSKSQRSPLGYAVENGEVKTSGKANTRRNKTLRKSLLQDFSNTTRNSESYSHFVKSSGHHHPVVACSPAHLHGCLKLDQKHGLPFFEFSLECPEDVFVAKTWKSDNAVNWIYTFHSTNSRKKSTASGWGVKDSNKESSMVGQMHVSCYLCSEQKEETFDNSMVTEFVLYDVAHSRKSVAGHENCDPEVSKSPKRTNESLVPGTLELDDVSDAVKLTHQTKHASDNVRHDPSRPYPWAQSDLRPDLEIAAIVVQVPFEKRQSLKCKRGDKISDRAIPNLLDHSMADQRRNEILRRKSAAKVNVVTPTGNHGLPNTETCPSSLLDRWRLGGGCDCGGWDMACPLIVFGNPSTRSPEDHPLMENHWPLELFVEGAKEKTPALTITFVKEGQYAVDFHARLSTLQAFSICLAILHSSEAFTAVGQDSNKQLLQCNSLKVLIGEQVKFLIEAVTEEEKNKSIKTMEQLQPSFVLNPPFSPISRV